MPTTSYDSRFCTRAFRPRFTAQAVRVDAGLYRGGALGISPTLLARAPSARALHAGNLAGLSDVAVGKQFKEPLSTLAGVSLFEVTHDMSGVRRDLVLLLLFAHEADHKPVIVCQCDSLLSRDLASPR